MASKNKAFEYLLQPVPPDVGVSIGMPGEFGMMLNSERGYLSIGNSRLGETRHSLSGDVRLDSPMSFQQGMFALPMSIVDNPLSTIPSTIFTPIQSKLPWLDISWLDIITVAAIMGEGALAQTMGEF